MAFSLPHFVRQTPIDSLAAYCRGAYDPLARRIAGKREREVAAAFNHQGD